MGISPLIFGEQTVENPQNAVISVVLPGEAETFLAIAKAEAEAARANKRIIETPAHIREAEANGDEMGTDEDNGVDRAEDMPQVSESASASDETLSESADKPNGKSAPVRRRRRSKSSAQTEDMPASAETSSVAAPVKKSAASSEPDDVPVASAPSADSSDSESDTDTEEKPEKVVRRRRRRSSAS